MPTAVQTPRIVDIDPLQQIILELRVQSAILAQGLLIPDEVANIRATVYLDYIATTTLTTGVATP